MSTPTHDVPPAADGVSPPLDVFRYGTEGGAEHYIVQPTGSERIVATLRIEPIRKVPVRVLKRVGIVSLPDVDGALVNLYAEAGPVGASGLTLGLASAFAARRGVLDEGYWLAVCPAGLVELATSLGWRALRRADTADDVAPPLALLLDDRTHLDSLGSPLAMLAVPRDVPIERLDSLRDGLDFDVDDEHPPASNALLASGAR